jgi:hypothetical protein
VTKLHFIVTFATVCVLGVACDGTTANPAFMLSADGREADTNVKPADAGAQADIAPADAKISTSADVTPSPSSDVAPSPDASPDVMPAPDTTPPDVTPTPDVTVPADTSPTPDTTPAPDTAAALVPCYLERDCDAVGPTATCKRGPTDPGPGFCSVCQDSGGKHLGAWDTCKMQYGGEGAGSCAVFHAPNITEWYSTCVNRGCVGVPDGLLCLDGGRGLGKCQAGACIVQCQAGEPCVVR